MPLELHRADYSHPEWPTLAAQLSLDVHSGVGVGAIDPPSTLPRTDRRGNFRRFMSASEMQPPKVAEILGITSFGLTLASSDILFISEVFVPRELRGCGYGRKIMLLIEEQARREGIKNMMLQSLESSLTFYQRLDFIKTQRSGDKFFMLKELS